MIHFFPVFLVYHRPLLVEKCLVIVSLSFMDWNVIHVNECPISWNLYIVYVLELCFSGILKRGIIIISTMNLFLQVSLMISQHRWHQAITRINVAFLLVRFYGNLGQKLLFSLVCSNWCLSLIILFFTISEYVDDIVTLIFQYLNMLRKEGPQEWVYEECRVRSLQILHIPWFSWHPVHSDINFFCATITCFTWGHCLNQCCFLVNHFPVMNPGTIDTIHWVVDIVALF